MANPPTDIPASELFLKLLERPAPSEVFAFPRRGADGEAVFSVRIIVLPEKKLEACRMRARKWLFEKAKDQSASTQLLDEHTMGDRLAKELLVEAVHEDRVIFGSDEHGSPKYHKLFRTADDVGELTADEVGALYGAYILTQMMFGPTDGSFEDQAEINAWTGRLAEGGRPFALPLLLSHQRDSLLLSLAQRSSTVLSILASPPENWQTSLESLRTSWQVGTGSSTAPAVGSTPSRVEPERVITQEEAMRAAQLMRRQSSLKS